MFMKVTFLILLARFPYKTSALRGCVPNSQTFLNGKICNCNSFGYWIEPGCYAIERRQMCTPGQIVFQGCNRCICQENGQLFCTEDTSCTAPHTHQNIHETLSTVLPWCNPFRTYYFNCNICICPASGKSSESHCALDTSCTLFKEPPVSEMVFKKTACIPTVMYLFPCLHCLCSDEGYFSADKCVKTCVGKQLQTSRRCDPKAIYRKDCNVCFCPENGKPDNKLCTNTTCTYPFQFGSLRSLKNKKTNCSPHAFTKPMCMYCDCNPDGKINEMSCLEHECLKSEGLRRDSDGKTCIPGAMVLFCTECFCPRIGITSEELCSSACSYQSKLKVLENLLASPNYKNVIDEEAMEAIGGSNLCKPHTVYLEKGRYCLCPDTGHTNFDLCTSADKNIIKPSNITSNFHVAIDFNGTCEPSTFVEFGCNTCFCTKNGTIDPKWCTYDDCESKRLIQQSHYTLSKHYAHPEVTPSESINNTCKPGSISIVECNFCICPESGIWENRVCTKNDCLSFAKFPTNNQDKFACEPLSYYEVDCNVCFCPRDGIKNVAKCTKNDCEKNFLRSDDVCDPGQLFSTECNVCVCPPNGSKAEKACTNYTCDTVPWSKIFQLSESLLGNQFTEDQTRNLDHCFPGEEYFDGCKLCVCPDMGLRIYSTCSPTFCDDDRHDEEDRYESQELSGSDRAISPHQKLNSRREDCRVFNYTTSLNRKECTPGSMYIVGCQQCVCPLRGDLRYFCRPMPKGVYCEQAFPGIDYVPMGRRQENFTAPDQNTRNSNSTASKHEIDKTLNQTDINSTISHPTVVQHEHTRYECKKLGQVTDDCFMCECDGETLIAEHCYQSNATNCKEATPTFLQGYVKPSKELKTP